MRGAGRGAGVKAGRLLVSHWRGLAVLFLMILPILIGFLLMRTQMPSLSDRAQLVQAEAALHDLQQALEAHRVSRGAYPSVPAEIETLAEGEMLHPDAFLEIRWELTPAAYTLTAVARDRERTVLTATSPPPQRSDGPGAPGTAGL